MKGLLLKDILVITKQLKIFLFVIPVMSLAGGGSMAALAVLMGAVLPMTAIAYDERSKWNEIAVMMPYSKKDIIVSKYLLGYFCMLGASFLVVLVQLVLAAMGQGDIANGFKMLLFSIFGGLIFISVNTPILFKFGSEKGRFVFIITMAVVAACGSIINSFHSNIFLILPDVQFMFLLVAAIIANFISIFISMRIKIN